MAEQKDNNATSNQDDQVTQVDGQATPSEAQLQGIDAQGANDATDLAAANDTPTHDSDVCVLTSAEQANGIAAPIVIAQPVDGDIPEIFLQPGQKYYLDFQQGDVASMVQKGDDLIITLNNGDTILLKNFDAATNAQVPATLTFQDPLGNDDFTKLVEVVETVPSEDDLEDPQAEVRVEGEETASGEDVASVEPAAGDEAPTQAQAQDAAQIEPAAGDDGAAGTGDRGGFGFQSSFDAQGVDGIDDVGPIDPTLLVYNLPTTPVETIFDEELAVSVDGVPDINDNPGIGFGAEVVDETGGLDTVSGTVGIDFGTDGAGSFGGDGNSTSSTPLFSQGVPVTINFDPATDTYTGVAGGTDVFTLEIEGNGDYTFTQLQPLDHPDATDADDVITLDFGIEIFDIDGDTDTGTITIDVRDDGPQIGNDTQNIDESNLGPIVVNGDLVETFGEDGAGEIGTTGNFSATGSVLGGTLTSNGVAVVVTETADGYIGTAGGNTVFELTLNSTTGEYEFTLNESLDHADPNDPNDIITLNFGVDITDFDGDTALGTITINVADDAPTIVQPQVPTIGSGFEIVDETTGIGDVFTGSIPLGTSGDQPVTVGTTGTTTITGVTTLTSGGQEIEIIETPDGYAGVLVDDNSVEVFTLDIDPETGDYEFVLLQPIDHPDTTNPDDSITIEFGIDATDADGDVATGGITIQINDDGPIAVDDSASTEDDTPVTGNIITNDDYGQDGPGTLTEVEFNGQTFPVPTDGSTVEIAGTYGTLVISNTGEYTYTPIPGSTGTDVFDYTIVDNDGDTSTATLTINVTPDSVPVVRDAERTVDETDLDPTDNVTGTLDIDFGADGFGSVGGNDTFSSGGSRLGDALTSNGEPVDVVFDPDTNTYTGTADGEEVFTLTIDPETGDYEFILTGTLDHADGTNPDDVITLDFGFSAVDGDGDAIPGTIRINVRDDGPTVVDPAESTLDESDLGPLTAGGFVDFDFGQDGGGSVTFNGPVDVSGSLEGGTLTSNGVPVVITQDADGNYVGTAGTEEIFTLTLNNETGEYEFTLTGTLDHADPNDPNDIITFEFPVTVTDFDGDSVQTTITINVADDAPTLPNNGNPSIGEGFEVVDETNLGPNVREGSVDVDFGQDGPGGLFGTDTFTSSGSQLGGVLTSNGVPVEVTQSINIETGAIFYTGVADGETIFTLEIDPANGDYTFTQDGVLDHADGADANDVITLEFGIEARDADGDTSTGTIRVNVLDDAPIANDDDVVFDQDASNSASGNVIDNDDLSNDVGNLVTQISFEGNDVTIIEGEEVSIDGNFGTLEIASDGTYTYTLFDTTSGDVTSTLSPEASDVDGVQSSITLNGITVASANGDDLTYLAEDGSGIGIAGQGSDKVFRNEALEVSFSASETVQLTIADIGPNNVNDTIDLLVHLADGTTQNFAFDIGTTTIVDGRIVIDLSAADFGGQLIEQVDISSDASFLLNDVSVTSPGARWTEDQFEYTLTDNDGDSDTAILRIESHDDDTPITISTEPLIVDETDLNPTDTDSGVIVADFGGDTPGSFTGNGVVSGDTLTSNGTPVDVNYDAATTVYTGTANGEDIFTFAINDETGEYEFTLIGTLDHPIAGPTAADHNDALVINFGVTAVDNEGDSANGSVAVTVLDDGPSISSRAGRIDESNLENGPISVTRTLDHDFGEDGAGTIEPTGNFSAKYVFGGPDIQLTSGGQDVTVNPTGNGYIGTLATGVVIFTLTINPANGTHTYTQFEGLDHQDPTNADEPMWLNFEVQITDADGDTDTAYIIVDVEDDAPEAVDDTDTTDGVTAVSSNLIDNDDVGADDPGSVTQITFGDQVVDIPEAGTRTITGDHGVLEIAADGTYTYTPNGTEGTDEFGYTLSDADGDTSTATLTINTDVDGVPTIGDRFARLDETDLDNGPIEVTRTIDHDFGPDGPGDIRPTGEFSTLFADGDLNRVLTSNGETVNVVQTDNGYVGQVSRVIGGDAILVQTVFTVDIDPTNGTFTYRQFAGLDHPDGSDANDVIWLKFEVQITDADGDVDTGYIQIDVVDDGVEAVDNVELFNINDGLFGGEVISNDNLSNDEPNQITEISFDGDAVEVPANGPATIDGEFGTLEINADGTYNYTLFDQPVRVVEQTFDSAALDFSGFQSSVELDGITVSSNNGQDLTFVPDSDPAREGSGIGIQDRNDVVFGRGEALLVSYENAVNSTKFTFGDIGANDVTDGIDFEITLSDGRVVDFEFDIGAATVIDGLIDVTLNASDFGGVSINQVEISSVINSGLGETSFVLNSVEAQRSVDVEPTRDVFQYTLTDADGDHDTATLTIEGEDQELIDLGGNLASDSGPFLFATLDADEAALFNVPSNSLIQNSETGFIADGNTLVEISALPNSVMFADTTDFVIDFDASSNDVQVVIDSFVQAADDGAPLNAPVDFDSHTVGISADIGAVDDFAVQDTTAIV